MMAGRELDALIATKIMGWTHIPVGSHANLRSEAWTNDDGASAVFTLPFYSQDIAAAWLVVEQLRKQMCCLRLVSDHHYLWEVYGIKDPDDDDHNNPVIVQWKVYASSEESAPHAICLAALQALTHAQAEGG